MPKFTEAFSTNHISIQLLVVYEIKLLSLVRGVGIGSGFASAHLHLSWVRTMPLKNFLDNIRSQKTDFYRLIYKTVKKLKNFDAPRLVFIYSFLYYERTFRHEIWRWLINKFYYEPLLHSRCHSAGKNLKTDGDIPWIEGSGKIVLGDNVRIGPKGAWFLTRNVCESPELIVGSNTSINYRTVISIEDKVVIGNNCLIAEETKIFDNNSHGIYYGNRKMTEKDVAPVIIEDHVWIGMNSTILKGVTIGKGAVVAAGSIVTKDVPPLTVVAGNPAKAVKKIVSSDGSLFQDF